MKDTVFVKLCVDLHCDWQGLPPDYRIYVDNELFAERTYRWEKPVYLTEILQINAVPDTEYLVTLDDFAPQIANFKMSNHRVEYCDLPVEFNKCKDKKFRFKVKNES